MTNAEIARILRRIAVLLEMEGVPFKPRAFEKAADGVDSCDEPLSSLRAKGGLKAIEGLPGIGHSIAGKIDTLLSTGSLPYFDELYAKYPVDLDGLTSIEGVGPKHMKALYRELGVRTVDDLEKAARAGRIRGLPGFGEKTERKILAGIEFLRRSAGRILLGVALPLMRNLEERLSGVAGVRKVAIAGSVRRRRETVGDGDILVVADRPAAVMDWFVGQDEVELVRAKGSTKASVRLAMGLDIDLRVVPRESFGAALNYFTGSKAHNVALRRIAQEKGLKLNEYGLFDGDRQVAGKTEEDVYAALGLEFVPAELREDLGEIEAAREGLLPRLIEYGEVRGDLQIQTDWSDGADSMENMVAAARRLGLEYIAITDHTKALAMMGQDEAAIRKQTSAIASLNRRRDGFRVLTGAEVNIDREGALDIADEILAELDVVGIAVHSHFHLSRAEQTRRIIRAMENPHADILFHPTARVLQKREACEVDFEAILEAARRTGTVLEVDGFPERLDLKDEHVRRAVQAGVKIVINTDAHAVGHLEFMEYGIATARRGWARRVDVVNAQPVEAFLRSLKGRSRRRSGRPVGAGPGTRR